MEGLKDNLYSLEKFRNMLSSEMEANKSLVRESGNSDVDVSVKVDTTPIAFAMLCSLLATKQISNEEFESAVRKLEELTNHKTHQSIIEDNDVTKAKLYREKRRRR
ncbi:hypothetical protein ACDX78_01765 [Virgibacillus oceani]